MCDRDDMPMSWMEHVSSRFAKQGSQRRRLWDLSRDTHCPVIGVCIPLLVLRKLIAKAVGGQAIADDYELHVGAISECAGRNRISELIQTELDHRYAVTIKFFRTAKTPQALTTLWLNAIHQGDVAGAFWAGLTHPQCDPPLQEGMCRDMHMLQHQAGACVRADLNRFNQMLEENATLSRELAKVQDRTSRMMQEKTREIEQLNEQVLLQRAEVISKESVISFLKEDILHVKAEVPQLETRQRLQEKVKQMGLHQRRLEKKIQELNSQLIKTKNEIAQQIQKFDSKEESNDEQLSKLNSFPITLYLNKKNVLCVGGRNSNVPSYRELIEKVGGKFMHHDGGLEDNHSMLEASLVAADLVICQTACISHNAYWRVKEFCKRTGKRCVFVENPSTSSLARSLETVSQTS
jgi:hypothetical protein